MSWLRHERDSISIQSASAVIIEMARFVCLEARIMYSHDDLKRLARHRSGKRRDVRGLGEDPYILAFAGLPQSLNSLAQKVYAPQCPIATILHHGARSQVSNGRQDTPLSLRQEASTLL